MMPRNRPTQKAATRHHGVMYTLFQKAPPSDFILLHIKFIFKVLTYMFICSWWILVKYTYRFTKRFSVLHENKGRLREEASVVRVLLDPSRNDSSGHQKENKTGAQFDVPGDINFTLLDLIKKIGTMKVHFYLTVIKWHLIQRS